MFGFTRYKKFNNRSTFIAALVGIHGLLLILGTLTEQIVQHRHNFHVDELTIDIPLLLGLALLYTSSMLRRRKRTAWIFATATYVFLLGLNVADLDTVFSLQHFHPLLVIRVFILPIIVLTALLLYRKDYVVRSDVRSFRYSVRVSIIVLLAALIYGVAGFSLLDKHDFHQEISFPAAVHYTIDQFDLTTNQLTPHTKRASIFQNSLSFISIAAVGFVFVSLFQPLRAHYPRREELQERAKRLINEHPQDSEEFFKLWPNDKSYFIGSEDNAGMAYKVSHGFALVAGNPFGKPVNAAKLLREFEDMCFVNDWVPAYVHTTPQWSKKYEKAGYKLQEIGEEASLDFADFVANIAGDKYFRQINNRFTKLGFSAEMLNPPHHDAVIARLKDISDNWLKLPGRAERGFMMGNFSPEYLQQCRIMVARDAAGTIQAFINLIPSYVPHEANYDLMRSSSSAPGNVNDYLLCSTITLLREDEYQRINLGLSPLSGLADAPDSGITKLLRFVYSNGDRLYSFQGLYRFKAKYKPSWEPRFIAYKGGASSLMRVTRALISAMKV